MGINNRIKAAMYQTLGYDKYASIMYRRYMGRFPNLHDPKLFTEKLWWLKYYNGKYQKELVQRCYDKLTVREYVESKGLKHILNDKLAIFHDANEILFNELPEKFVIKVTQSSGKNLICTDKRNIDEEYWKTTLNDWLKETNNTKQTSFDEGYLFNGHAVLLCEKMLEDENGNIPYDYRVFCFNGHPKYIVCDVGTTNADGTHGSNIYRNVYDLDWNLQPVDLGRSKNESIIIEKPDNLREMLNIAERLSEDFVFARIDLYNVKKKIIFGEITWIPMGGAGKITPLSWDAKLGEELELPKVVLF